MGIGQQVIERIIVALQLLALCLHKDILSLALVSQADPLFGRFFLACNGRESHYHNHYYR